MNTDTFTVRTGLKQFSVLTNVSLIVSVSFPFSILALESSTTQCAGLDAGGVEGGGGGGIGVGGAAAHLSAKKYYCLLLLIFGLIILTILVPGLSVVARVLLVTTLSAIFSVVGTYFPNYCNVGPPPPH